MKIMIVDEDGKKRREELESVLLDALDKAEAWELRCAELEQELRDAQDRIHEMDWTIAQYDDENRRLKEANADTVEDVMYYKGEMEQYKADVEELKKRNDRLWLQNRNMATWQSRSEAVEGHKLDSEMLEDYGNCTPPKASLNEWAERIHENAVAHGWWAGGVLDGDRCGIFEDVDRPLPEILMLCVTELAEAMEEYRNGKPLLYEGENGKPEGIAVEMVDCIIRILDWMGHNGVDVDELIRKKHAYNLGRPYRHGGKLA